MEIMKIAFSLANRQHSVSLCNLVQDISVQFCRGLAHTHTRSKIRESHPCYREGNNLWIKWFGCLLRVQFKRFALSLNWAIFALFVSFMHLSIYFWTRTITTEATRQPVNYNSPISKQPQRDHFIWMIVIGISNCVWCGQKSANT